MKCSFCYNCLPWALVVPLGSELAGALGLHCPSYFVQAAKNTPKITEFGPVHSLPCRARAPREDRQLRVGAVGPRPPCDLWLCPRTMVPRGGCTSRCPCGLPSSPPGQGISLRLSGPGLGRLPWLQCFSQKTDSDSVSQAHKLERGR